MSHSWNDKVMAPRRADLGLSTIANRSGFEIALLPSGAIFAMEHVRRDRRIMINQVLGSPIACGMGGLFLRIGGAEPMVLPVAGAQSRTKIGTGEDRFIWKGERCGLRHRVGLWLHPHRNIWLWRLDVVNLRETELSCDAVFVQDLGLGEPGFLTNNEAYASQYLDQHIARHPHINFVVMSRQNLAQGDAFPWVAHGCLEGAAGFATDFRQLMGPSYRDVDKFDLSFGANLPSTRLQFETACAALQSKPAAVPAGDAATWTFFGLYKFDHPKASAEADLRAMGDVKRAARDWTEREIPASLPIRSVLHEAPCVVADPLDGAAIKRNYRRRMHVEDAAGSTLSFFIRDNGFNRHVVLRDKERIVARRHGALLRSGRQMLPDESTLCVTCWMHGVFGAQLTIGNTSFHKLFSVSRDPYNITRASGLRILISVKERWRLLTVPSAFEMGLGDCRWIYRFGDRTITVVGAVSGEEPAAEWRVVIEGEPCRVLIFAHLVLGDQELTSAGRVEIDPRRKRFTFRPDPDDRWGQQYPRAVYHLVMKTRGRIEAMGGDELLYADGKRRGGAYVAVRTRPTKEFAFAVVGSMTDPKRAENLAKKYAKPDAATSGALLAGWRHITRGVRIKGVKDDDELKAIDTILPWLAHDAMVHLTVPHGLEQYTGAAWGTRDVCQGPIELLLSLEHDEPVKAILRIIFSYQYEQRGDWPQWFMLEPYSDVQGMEAHGDVIVWPLKALCDYIEATGDFTILDEPLAWRRDDNLKSTDRADPIMTHVDKLMSTICERFVSGTKLIRYGHGDWNDSLQPVDPSLRDSMTSSWTVALLYEQLRRYAEILRRVGRRREARERDSLALVMRKDFNRFLIRDGVVAGYAVFGPDGGLPRLLLHPDDHGTGVSYSLFPMIQAIIGGLFTAVQTRRHLGLIRRHLLFSDGARLMDKPVVYHGGLETIFRRAESAAFFGREIGLMYVHSHLRYAEAMGVLGESQALWDALQVVNPIAVTDRLGHASLRQRNAYFSSSDAAFSDRYQASSEWERVRDQTIAVEGGWRIYSSGPGLYANMVIRHALGVRRHFGKRVMEPCLPPSKEGSKLVWAGGLAPQRPGRRSRRGP